MDLQIYRRPGLSTLRPISFIFYTLETIFNLFCMAYHIKGFMSHKYTFTWQESIQLFFYLISFYVFAACTLFQSINICSGHMPALSMEILKACLASITFLIISMLTMWDAEFESHKMYSGKEPQEGVYESDKPAHRFIDFMIGQAVSSLSCGIIYLLHATILIDVKLTAKYTRLTAADGYEYMPIDLYVFSEFVQRRLEKYEWFREFCLYGRIDL